MDAKRFRWIGVALVGLLLACATIRACSAPHFEQLLQLTAPTPGKAGSLRVPIVRYERGGLFGKKDRVDFVGAVHLGEPQYYRDLNERFKSYDAVLFELVGDPAEFAERRHSDNQSMLGVFQAALAGLLGLQFQLDGIRYDAPNFVHADLTGPELVAAMTARGETLFSVVMKLLKLSFDPQVQDEMKRSGLAEVDLEGVNPLVVAIRGPTDEERKKIKLYFAYGLASSDVMMKAFQGEQGVALIDDRNAAAIAVMQEELSKGKRNVAIFYGVGHLPDLHKRLTNELGFSVVKVEWVEAWKL